jgi:hypothetical protein
VRELPLPDNVENKTGAMGKMTFGEAFGVEGHTRSALPTPGGANEAHAAGLNGYATPGYVTAHRPGQTSYDEDIRLQPYPVAGAGAVSPTPLGRGSGDSDDVGRGTR